MNGSAGHIYLHQTRASHWELEINKYMYLLMEKPQVSNTVCSAMYNFMSNQFYTETHNAHTVTTTL